MLPSLEASTYMSVVAVYVSLIISTLARPMATMQTIGSMITSLRCFRKRVKSSRSVICALPCPSYTYSTAATSSVVIAFAARSS